MRLTRVCTARSARGFTLVEVLVAIVLVGYALLALAHLQLASAGAGRAALESLAATGHVASHADRVRALHDAPDEAWLALGESANVAVCAPALPCTPAEFAATSAYHWAAPAERVLESAHAAPPRLESGTRPRRAALEMRHGRARVALEVDS